MRKSKLTYIFIFIILFPDKPTFRATAYRGFDGSVLWATGETTNLASVKSFWTTEGCPTGTRFVVERCDVRGWKTMLERIVK
jgi:hypothetical protein